MGLNRQDCLHLLTILTAARITGAESETVTELKFKVRELDKQLEAAEFNVKFDEKIEAQRLAAVDEEAQRIEKIGRELAAQSEDSRQKLIDEEHPPELAEVPYTVPQLDAG